jgi:single-stranded DNA-specific DHH superfamily exonuclease
MKFDISRGSQMRHASNPRITECSNNLALLKNKLELLNKKRKSLLDKIEEEEQFLYERSKGRSFQFDGEDGYLMQVDFIERKKIIIDRQKIEKIFEKLGKSIPKKKSTWIEVSLHYVQEEE